MAQQLQTQYEFHYQRAELLKTEEFGIGLCGAVCKAMCDDLPCAAKNSPPHPLSVYHHRSCKCFPSN